MITYSISPYTQSGPSQIQASTWQWSSLQSCYYQLQTIGHWTIQYRRGTEQSSTDKEYWETVYLKMAKCAIRRYSCRQIRWTWFAQSTHCSVQSTHGSVQSTHCFVKLTSTVERIDSRLVYEKFFMFTSSWRHLRSFLFGRWSLCVVLWRGCPSSAGGHGVRGSSWDVRGRHGALRRPGLQERAWLCHLLGRAGD